MFRVVTKTDSDYVKLVLAAAREDTMVHVLDSEKVIEFTEFEAFRTGIPEIRKTLKPRRVMLQSYYFDFVDYRCEEIESINWMCTSAKGELAYIDRGYKKGQYLNIFLRCPIAGSMDSVYVYHDYRLIFTGPGRTPTIRFRPTYTSIPPSDMTVKDFMDLGGQTPLLGTGTSYNEQTALYYVLPKLVKF